MFGVMGSMKYRPCILYIYPIHMLREGECGYWVYNPGDKLSLRSDLILEI
jgi:hypothetical protein